MADVLVEVKKPLTYQGHSYVRGELVKMEAVDALVAGRRGDVDLTKRTLCEQVARQKAIQAATRKPARRTRANRYRTRHMVSESEPQE